MNGSTIRHCVTVVMTLVVTALPPIRASALQEDDCRFETIAYTNDGLKIVGGIYYKADEKRYPILVFNHGTPTDAVEEKRLAWERYFQQPVACRFVRVYGVTVFVAERRGYGLSEGETWIQHYSRSGTRPQTSERGSVYVRRLQQEAADVMAGIAVVQGRPYARQEYVAWGHSGGGIITLFIGGRNPSGLLGVINSAGGIGWDSGCFTCYYREVSRAAQDEGLRTNTPILILTGPDEWFHIPNRQLHAALRQAGKTATLLEYPGVRHGELWPVAWRQWTEDTAQFVKSVLP
jgi:dipeptidyl aminopeptidase/acylaminoacyl peptidase